MTTFNTAQFETIIKETTFLCDYIDTPYITNSESFDNEDDLKEYLEDRIRECEVIYYHTAIDFLKDNDPSLGESLELASDMGYETKNLNSELLATLLLQQKLSNELSETDFTECFTESEEE